jgi:nucleoside-diphosphate-sugar epimerase
MNILIIGGTYFIGPHVVAQLLRAGHEVTIFHRGKGKCKSLPEQVNHIHGDRVNMHDFREDFRNLLPEVVLDMIPMSEQDADTLMKVFTGIAKRIVALSSQDVYRAWGRLLGSEPGPIDEIPLYEDSPLREKFYPYRDKGYARNDYDKILVERKILGVPELPGTIIRLPMVYGQGDYQHRLYFYLKRMDDHRPAILLSDKLASWSWAKAHVENAAHAIVLAATIARAAGSIYNVSEVKTISTLEWVQLISKITGWQGKVIVLADDRLPDHLKANLYAPQDFIVDSSKIRRELGFAEPVSLEQGLELTIAWERENPPKYADQTISEYAIEDDILADLQI